MEKEKETKSSLLSHPSVSEPRCFDVVWSLASFCTDGSLDDVQHLFDREGLL